MNTMSTSDQTEQPMYGDRANPNIVIFLHAFPLDHQQWAPQISSLVGEFRVLCPDLPGFGSSLVPGQPWTIDSAADQLADWMLKIKIHVPVVVCGLSMGGYIALALARRHPASLKGLILADTRADADSAEARQNRDVAIATVKQVGVRQFFEEKMLPRIISPKSLEKQPELRSQVLEMAAWQSADGVIAGLQALKDRPDATADLAGIKVPTLVICGENDVLTPPAVSHAMTAAIPGAKCVIIPEAGHLTNLEAPSEFTAAIMPFLEQLSTR